MELTPPRGVCDDGQAMRGGLLRSWSLLTAVAVVGACSNIIGISSYEIDPKLDSGSGAAAGEGGSGGTDTGGTDTGGTAGTDTGGTAGTDTGGTTGTDTGGTAGTESATGGTAGTAGTTTAAAGTVSATDSGCSSSTLIPGKPVPEGAFECGHIGALTSTGGETDPVLDNDADYVVAVATEDSANNIGVLSNLACARPQDVTGFFEAYNEAGGDAGGGFCSFAPARHDAWAIGMALLLGACALWRRRQ